MTMTLREHWMYSIVVDLGDDGDVSRMLFGDNLHMETMELDIAKCPDFIFDRVALLKLCPLNTYVRDGDRDAGLKLNDKQLHIYLSVEERDEIFNLLKESANASRTISKSNQVSERKPKLKGQSGH